MENIFEHALFLLVFSFGLITLIAGRILIKFPPKSINMLYGYRTASSMKSQEAWDFAQVYSARLMTRLAVYLILGSFLFLLFDVSEIQAMIIGLPLVVIVAFSLIFFTERAIKKRFKKSES